jgi:ABC-type bacteriocin/lantibiotic exporter with double-glycine peptidase domain
MREMATEGRLFRDIGLATLIMAFLVTIPPLVLMVIADRVLLYQSWSTLYLLAAGLAVAVLYETMLGWAQRHLTNVAARASTGGCSFSSCSGCCACRSSSSSAPRPATSRRASSASIACASS